MTRSVPPNRMLPKFAVLIALLIATSGTAATDSGNDRFKTWFEWGDYDLLIDSLVPHLARVSDSLHPKKLAIYHLYSALAFFSVGKTGEAQHHYFDAMRYDSTFMPDPRYLSEPMKRFCSEQRDLFHEQKRQQQVQDSLELVRSRAFEHNVRSIKKQAFRSARTTDAVIGSTLLVAGAGAASIAAYQYYSTKEEYRQFREHAAAGRKREYDNMLPVLQRANKLIFAGGLASALFVSGGLVFTLRAALGHRGKNE